MPFYPHDHAEYVDGCFRCELSRAEVAEDVRFVCPSCGASELTGKATSALRCGSCNIWMERRCSPTA